MEKHHMPIESSLAAIWGLLTKTLSFKGLAGLIGAAMLYMLMPPGPPVVAGTVISDPKAYKWATRKELAIRFGFAFLTSELAGEWFVDFVQANAAWLQAGKHPLVFVGMMGAGGWYVGRWVALWLHKRQNTGLDQVVRDAKELLP
jgi:hypothetical protein